MSTFGLFVLVCLFAPWMLEILGTVALLALVFVVKVIGGKI